MEEKELKKLSIPELEAVLSKADADGRLLFAVKVEKLLEDKKKTEAEQSTSIGEQALTGFYDDFANALGAPVDMATAGLNKLGLGSEQPVGGSQSIKNLMQFVSGGEALNAPDPQTAKQRIARGTGEVLGSTLAATGGLVAAAPKQASNASASIYNSLRNALADLRGQVTKTPGTALALETAAATGGGVAESTVAELTENPTARTMAGILGALAVGGTAGKMDDLIRRYTNVDPNTPINATELKFTAGKIYDNQIDNGLSAQPSITDNIARRAFEVIDNNGLLVPGAKNTSNVDPEYAKVAGLMRILDGFADKGMTGAQILSQRKGIMNRINDSKGTERNVLRNILRTFDEEMDGLTDGIRIANKMYSRAMKAEQVEELMDLARASAAGANLNLENAIRTQFRQLHRRIIKGQETGWTPTEVEQIKNIVEGGNVENILRFVGKLAPTNPAITIGLGSPGAVMANQITGDPLLTAGLATGAMTTGIGARMAAGQAQKANAQRLAATAVQGRDMTPAGQKRMMDAITAYLAGQAATQ